MRWGLPWGSGSLWGAGLISSATASEYGTIMAQLLPRGVIWTDDPARGLMLLLDAFGDEYARVHNRYLDLIEEADPRTTSEMIGDWERVFGLPDPCDTSPPTALADRQAALLAKILDTGGQSIAYYTEIAAALGVTITITEQQYGVPFRAGTGRAGEALSNVENVYYWQVNAPAATAAALRTRMECIFARIKPAHTVVEFVYS